MADMPTPVTTELRDALSAAVQLDAMFNDLGRDGVNDRAHYAQALAMLDRLVTALLIASAASPTTRREYTGARFDLGDKNGITPLMTEAAQYLMGDSQAVLHGKLSAYSDTHVKQVRGELAALVGVTLAGVARCARADMDAILEASTGRFLTMVDHLAVAAKADPVAGEMLLSDRKPDVV